MTDLHAQPASAQLARRIALDAAEPRGDANILRRYPIEAAAWVWHPRCAVDEPAVLRFTNTFTLDAPAATRLHVSADQRYELFLDGQYLGMGPDRSDLDHWSFASYQLDLEPGEHVLEALVWWIGGDAPTAQVSLRGGFICAADQLASQLDTGQGPWQVHRLEGWSFHHVQMHAYHAIGGSQTVDGSKWHAPAPPAEPAVVVAGPVNGNATGIVQNQWQLEPSPLPDMLRRAIAPGRVRAVCPGDADVVEPDHEQSDRLDAWQRLVADGEPIDLPAHCQVQMIWDLEDYYCGYADLTLTGGADSELAFEWAESLYAVDEAGERSRYKGDRNAIAGKTYFGFGDRFRNDGGEQRDYRSCWWRSGRYVRVTVRTGAAALRIERLGVIETRYPWENQSQWRSDDAQLAPVARLAVRGLQMCMHETYMDCPYYEQMMYVGDTRLQMLVSHVCNADARLTRRGIELFDWSRYKTGLIAERYPSTPFQLSATFSMIWVSMVRDHAWWRDEPGWVRERLVGVRCLLEQFLPWLNEDGLIGRMPGWSFMDWVPEWKAGCAPDGRDGVSALNNLLFVHALRDAAALERAHGEQPMAARYEQLADRIGGAIVAKFWHEPTGCLADDLAHEHFSEHAQCLGLLTGTLQGGKADAALHRLIDGEGLVRTTVYFSFYLLETLYRFGHGEKLVEQFAFWKQLVEQGMRTPVEMPEPSRSDCHAWGSHPLFHFHASLAGIRPDAPGFARVRIAPLGAGPCHVESSVPHPAGRVAVVLDFSDDGRRCRAALTLPAGTPGTFVWAGHHIDLPAGERTELDLTAQARG